MVYIILTITSVIHVLQYQSEEFGVDPKDLASMSQSELAMRMGGGDSDAWKKKNKGKVGV